MEYEEIRQLEMTHICATCGGPLVTVWDAENEKYRSCCGKDPTHNGIKRMPTATQVIARGELDSVAGPGAQKDIEQQARQHPKRFTLLPRQDAQTGAWLTPQDIDDLASFAESIGLNAYLGHVELYYGKPRVSIDGYYYKAKTRGENIAVLALPASPTEYELYKVDKADYFSIARGWVDNVEAKEVGLGILTQAEISEMSLKHPDQKRYPIAVKYPQRTAEHRAEWQLLRKLIPLEVKE